MKETVWIGYDREGSFHYLGDSLGFDEIKAVLPEEVVDRWREIERLYGEMQTEMYTYRVTSREG